MILVQYLTDHEYSQPLTQKQLESPSLKEFKTIAEFLFKQLDPNFKFGDDFCEDIRDVIKMVGYPFNISKSSLSAVGSPHTWPHVLAMLVWVIELLYYLEELEEEEEKNGQTDEAKIFFQFIADAYGTFLEGEDNFDDLIAEFKDTLGARIQALEEECAKFQQTNEELNGHIEEFSQDCNTVPGLLSEREKQMLDLEKFEKLNSKLESYRKKLLEKKENAETELETLDSKIAQHNSKQEELKVAIQNQPLSLEEVKRIVEETQIKEKKIASQKQQKKETDQAIFNTEMDLVKLSEALDQLTKSYNTQVAEIQAATEQSAAADLQITFQPHADDIKEMVSQDLTHTVKPALAKIEEKYKSMCRALESQLRDVKQERRRTSDMADEAKDKVKQCEQRLTKIHEAYRTERDGMNKQTTDTQNSLQEIELLINRTKNQLTNELRDSEQKLREIDEQTKVARKQNADVEQKAQEEIAEMVEALSEHRDWIIQKLTSVSDKVIAAKADVEDFCSSAV